ncbi:hypothetical protein MNEG_9691 [Monoraphidium neglectum]|uniref:Uncharacterized protein n=1 Tax=Monoraphidium neglectum TaxID=145388 RepID=A0A0D2MV86_9CHLO|nr:hypothetical protein MNEG_9691 [Monoraphidium neglectum]KIY98270.1 hypothetical protein MNEG_9691 [Monoraphidium neglectum]|eukprot:XP_013897290.1 hypothetical protein MNEG_9691 [Monoraphidium neglectum]
MAPSTNALGQGSHNGAHAKEAKALILAEFERAGWTAPAEVRVFPGSVRPDGIGRPGSLPTWKAKITAATVEDAHQIFTHAAPALSLPWWTPSGEVKWGGVIPTAPQPPPDPEIRPAYEVVATLATSKVGLDFMEAAGSASQALAAHTAASDLGLSDKSVPGFLLQPPSAALMEAASAALEHPGLDVLNLQQLTPMGGNKYKVRMGSAQAAAHLREAEESIRVEWQEWDGSKTWLTITPHPKESGVLPTSLTRHAVEVGPFHSAHLAPKATRGAVLRPVFAALDANARGAVAATPAMPANSPIKAGAANPEQPVIFVRRAEQPYDVKSLCDMTEQEAPQFVTLNSGVPLSRLPEDLVLSLSARGGMPLTLLPADSRSASLLVLGIPFGAAITPYRGGDPLWVRMAASSSGGRSPIITAPVLTDGSSSLKQKQRQACVLVIAAHGGLSAAEGERLSGGKEGKVEWKRLTFSWRDSINEPLVAPAALTTAAELEGFQGLLSFSDDEMEEEVPDKPDAGAAGDADGADGADGAAERQAALAEAVEGGNSLLEETNTAAEQAMRLAERARAAAEAARAAAAAADGGSEEHAAMAKRVQDAATAADRAADGAREEAAALGPVITAANALLDRARRGPALADMRLSARAVARGGRRSASQHRREAAGNAQPFGGGMGEEGEASPPRASEAEAGGKRQPGEHPTTTPSKGGPRGRPRVLDGDGDTEVPDQE